MTQLPDSLPELPQPPLSHVDNWGSGSEVVGEYEAMEYARAYGLSCYQAGLERSAAICDEQEGAVDGAAYYAVSRCAEAIRAEKALTDTALPPPA